jgi:hypothetical protein
VSSQPSERQAHLAACLDKMLADVGRNLEPKNRDKFTQVGGEVCCGRAHVRAFWSAYVLGQMMAGDPVST